MSHEDSEYEPLDYTWRVIYGPGAVVRTGPLASDQAAGPPLSFGQVVHPAGKPVWMTFDEFNNQAATKWGQTHLILRLPVWMGSDKDTCGSDGLLSDVTVDMAWKFHWNF